MLLNFSLQLIRGSFACGHGGCESVTGDWRPIGSIKPAGHSSLSTSRVRLTVYRCLSH